MTNDFKYNQKLEKSNFEMLFINRFFVHVLLYMKLLKIMINVISES